jgi:hypothetical protein
VRAGRRIGGNNRARQASWPDKAGFTESEDHRMIVEKNGFASVANEYFKRGSTDFYPVFVTRSDHCRSQ